MVQKSLLLFIVVPMWKKCTPCGSKYSITPHGSLLFHVVPNTHHSTWFKKCSLFLFCVYSILPPCCSKSVLNLPIGKFLFWFFIHVPHPQRVGLLSTVDVVVLPYVLTHSAVQTRLSCAIEAKTRTPDESRHIQSTKCVCSKMQDLMSQYTGSTDPLPWGGVGGLWVFLVEGVH